MSMPVLYVKRGCPYCAAAMKALEERGIDFERVEVRGNPAGMQKLQAVSGQTRTPTLVWGDEVLPDFGVDQLEPFLTRVTTK